MTNTVALAFTSVGAAAGSRPELVGQWPTVRRFAALTALGGGLGAGLLLITPPGAFEKVVPVLIGGAGAVLLFQPQIREAVLRKAGRDDPDHHSGPFVLAGILAVAVYGGYFGAAAGVMLLALLLVALPVSLLQGNAIKNVLLGLSNAVAAIGFAVFDGRLVGRAAAGRGRTRGRTPSGPCSPGTCRRRPCGWGSRWPGSGSPWCSPCRPGSATAAGRRPWACRLPVWRCGVATPPVRVGRRATADGVRVHRRARRAVVSTTP